MRVWATLKACPLGGKLQQPHRAALSLKGASRNERASQAPHTANEASSTSHTSPENRHYRSVELALATSNALNQPYGGITGEHPEEQPRRTAKAH